MIRMAFRNMFRQKRRSLLTALTMFGGFILGALAIGLTDGTFNGIVNAFTRSRMKTRLSRMRLAAPGTNPQSRVISKCFAHKAPSGASTRNSVAPAFSGTSRYSHTSNGPAGARPGSAGS